jgi:hypothetical protein
MAEFKLGRIKFVWKDEWATAQPYYVDDIVRYGGQTFVCVVGHASAANFYTDLNNSPTKWNLMTDGQTWKGDWAISTFYGIGDIVKYGGLLYVCNLGHTSAATLASGLEADQDLPTETNSKWDLFAEGFDWKSNWAITTRYKKNDLVKYGGTTYVCNTGHTSAGTTTLGLENNTAYWDTFNAGFDYKGAWVTATRYKANDLVKFGAGLWICTTQHTAAADFLTDLANWSQFVKGVEFENAWSSATQYQPGDIVRYGGNQYVAKTVHTNSNPVTGTSNWDLFTEGFKYQSDWVNSTSYKIGEVVRLNGKTYLAAADSPSLAVTVTAATASNDQFTIASTTGIVVGMTVRFTGSTFGEVFATGRYYVKTVAAGFITISTTPGGATFNVTVNASGSMTATLSAEPPNASYWTLLQDGIKWQGEWIDDTEYNSGDAVRYGSNAYICILAHRSEADDASTVGVQGGGQALSRPDRDATGTYWNLLSSGSETAVLTTLGDLVYYGGAGPTRLPVGTKGQVLRVSESLIPEWVLLGKVDHVYYVAPHGTDEPYPTSGGTFDRPWKTIRYACEQIDQGPRYPDAQRLLELNRAFIQREVTEWVDYQVTYYTTTVPTVGSKWYNYDYDEYKCERDTGFLVDRLIWDLGHGGNLKMRAAAQAYVNALADGPFSTGEENNGTGIYSRLATEQDNDVDAFNYMLTLVANVFNQTAPTQNYQVLNGDNSTAVIAQAFDSNIVTAEPGALADVTALVAIVNNALTAQNATSIPDRVVPSQVLYVKTGTYTETLPIIVPAETSLHGDETRSVTVQPSSGTTNRTDVAYSIGAMGRLETVLGNLIIGSSVTPTTGNITSQSIAVPFASSVEQTAVQQLVRTIQHRIDYSTGAGALVLRTEPTGYNVGYLTGYKDARDLLIENKEFIKSEIVAYITANYSTVKYSRTKCKRDVGYIVDAMAYDLTYGGYSQTLNAGLAYFDGNSSTTLMIDSTEIAATVASYGRLKTVMQQIAANTLVSATSGNTASQWRDGTYRSGGSSASAFIGSGIDIITNIIAGDSTASLTPQINITTIATLNTLTSTSHGLTVGDAIIPRITANGLTAGVKYWVVGTVAANTFQLAATYGGSVLASFTNGTGLDIDAEKIDYPTATNAVSSTTALIAAAVTLDAAQETIVTNATSYLTATYPTLVYNSTKCQRDVRLILEAVMFDFMFNSNNQVINAAYSYLRSSATDVFDKNQKTATRAAFTYVKTQAKSNVGGNATAQARIETLMTTLDDIVFGATNDGSVCQTEIRAADYARLQIERNRTFIAAEIDAYIANTYIGTVTATTVTTNLLTVADTSWMRRGLAVKFGTGTALTVIGGVDHINVYYINNVVSATQFTVSITRYGTDATLSTTTGSMQVKMYYSSSQCLRDVGTYLDAIKFDLMYPGNYASRLAARYYSNSVMGSLEEDFFYVRNGTGIKNMTMSGLTGDLLPANAYGTSRVSAGSYVSLDPGWGPADFRTWIISRSPYIQNNATFGYAATGQKIDGALHNGGNKSIVSNDFTQIISDGIGAWITNNGRAELVSVFSYYSYIGYLAENGGRIRGTNGNNSYGNFGAVAEGFDATETPNTAVVDNTSQYTASVGSVFTDGVNQVLAFEFDNAGNDYTEVTWSIGGAGGLAEAEQMNEFRDDAVYNIHLLDNVDDSTAAPEADGNFGGSGYLTASNTAQGGTATQITIAATDSNITGAYVGMKIYLKGGTGAGQVGIIASYDSGTKVVTVTKESTGAAGWDHVLMGTAIVSPDASTTYIIEPRITLSSPSYSTTARTLPSLEYVDGTYADVFKLYAGATGTTSGSGSGATFDVLKKGVNYTVTLRSPGLGYARLDTITILGTALGGTSANNITITVTSINSVTGSIQVIESSGYGQGGNFIAIATATRNIATSPDGTTWTQVATALPTSTTWTAVASGKLTNIETAGSFIIGRTYKIEVPGNTVFTSIGAADNAAGTVFVATGNGGATTGTASQVTTVAVAIASGGTASAYSVDGGATWTAGGALPATATWSAIAYGNGRWVAVASGSADNAFSTNGGVSWTAGGTGAVLGSATWTGIAYGGGRFVAIASGGATTYYTTNGGITWTLGTGLASSNWNAITYGEGKFVAVSSTSGTAAAYSLTGAAWTAATLPSTAAWSDVRYGQGLFFAVSGSTAAASSEDGVNWTARTTSTAANGFSAAVFGNPNRSGVWALIQRSTAGTVASSVLCGTTARARAFVADTKIYAIRIVEPGSGYLTTPTLTITDPNNIFEAPTLVRTGKGVLATPNFVNRGTGYSTATATLFTGNGVGNYLQSGQYIAIKRLTQRPVAGSNVVFAHLPDQTFKVVNVLSYTGSYDGSYKGFFQISPTMKLINVPADGTALSTRIRYSQVRLTGHDFLNIGFGNFTQSNYPDDPISGFALNQANETVENNGGRVFYTSTDQDGNFRVGGLFNIEQSTGIATLNADAFNISGLQELSLGNLSLGGGSAIISEFSTDPFFTANSDSIVPTQRAIKSYISSQIGGGGASLNVNSVTAGYIYILGNQITTTSTGPILMKAKFEFRGGVVGLPISWNYFLN